MRLFFKHLFKNIVQKPLQPLIIILTLALSVAVSAFTMQMDALLDEEFSEVQTARFGTADIRIAPDSTSKTRFLFAEDAERLLDGRGKAVGCFELPMFYGEEKDVAFGVAVDFFDIGEVFDIEFTKYGTVTRSTVSDSIFVSSAFAEKNGLNIGDRLELELVGVKRTYKLRGISKNTLLAAYDVMVDVSGVIRVLAADNLLLSSMGDSFKPSSAIYVDVADGESLAECVSVLRSDPAFCDKEINDVSKYVDQQINNTSMEISLSFAIALSFLLAATVCFSCLYLLSLGRAEENEVFFAAGAQRKMLNTARYVEVFAYWIVGGTLGVILAALLIRAFAFGLGFEYAEPRIDLLCAVRGSVSILIVSLLTVALFNLSDRTSRKRKIRHTKLVLPLASALLFALLVVCSLVLHGKIRMLLFAASLVAMIFTLLLSVPDLLRLAMRMIEKRVSLRRRAGRFPLLYAAKNISSVKVLHNTALLVVLVFSVLITLTFVIVGGWGTVDAIDTMICGDYAVLNATDRCSEKLEDVECVESVHLIYLGNATDNGGLYVNALSVSDTSALSEGLNVELLPQGKEAVITRGIAEMMLIEVGDAAIIEIAGKPLELEIVDIVDSAVGFVLFDSDHFGIAKSIIAVEGRDGYSRNEILDGVSREISLEMAAVVPISDLFEEKTKNLSVFLESGKMMLVMLVIFVAIGIADNLFESYRARREDFEMFVLAGMSRREILRLKLCEVSTTFIFGTLLGIILAFVLMLSVNSAMESYGYSSFSGFLAYFKIM